MLTLALAALLLGTVSVPAADASDAGPGSTVTPQQILQRRYEQARPRTAIPFNPSDFDKFAGYYLLPGLDQVVHIYRQDGHFFMKGSLSVAPVEIYPESATEFFMKVVPAQISFNLASGGQVTGLVTHSGGLLQTLSRISESRAREVNAELQARVRQDKPSPGTAAAARRLIETLETGHPDYQEMMPNLAGLARLQQPLTRRMFQTLGPLQSLEFKKVAASGLDIYDATFAHGAMRVLISPLTADKRVTAFAIIRPTS